LRESIVVARRGARRIEKMGEQPATTTAAGVPEDYARLLADLRAIIAAGRGRAAAAVN